MIINKIQESCTHLFPLNRLVSYYLFQPKRQTFNSEFSYIEVWFTNQNSKPLEIEDKINITLVIS